MESSASTEKHATRSAAALLVSGEAAMPTDASSSSQRADAGALKAINKKRKRGLDELEEIQASVEESVQQIHVFYKKQMKVDQEKHNQEVETLKKGRDEELRKMKTAVEALGTSVQTEKAALKTFVEKQLKHNKDMLAGAFSTCDKERIQAQTQCTELASKVEELEEKLMEVEKMLKKTEELKDKETKEQQKDIKEEYEKKLQSIEKKHLEEMEDLRSCMTVDGATVLEAIQLKTTMRTMSESLKICEEERNEATASCKEMEKKVKRLDLAVRIAMGNLADSKKERQNVEDKAWKMHEKLQKEVGELKGALARSDADVLYATSELEQTRKEAADGREEVASVCKKFAEKCESFRQKTDECDRLKEKLEAEKKAARDAADLLKRVEEEVEDLKRQLEEEGSNESDVESDVDAPLTPTPSPPRRVASNDRNRHKK